MWVKDGKYARIRTGAIVGQDMGFGKWVDEGEVFRVSDTLDQQCRCLRAYGYGVIGDPTGKAYGNGALFVKEADLIYESDEANQQHVCIHPSSTPMPCPAKCQQEARIRAQAIKDVAIYLKHNGYGVIDLPSLAALWVGKIPDEEKS